MSAYALDLICLTPKIKPGDPIEVEIFVVGRGSLTHNKMIINYPISLIDEDNPGFIEYCIGVGRGPSGNIRPITGEPFLEIAEKKGLETSPELSAYGTYYLMGEGNFLENPGDSSLPENAIPRLLAEMRHDGLSPMYMKLNSSKETPSGDYEINFNFTYIDDDKIYLDQKAVKIHISSWSERHLTITTLVGLLLALNLGGIIIRLINLIPFS